MKPVMVPTSDVNSETALVVAWRVPARSQVAAGQLIAELETSKAVIEVPVPEAGWLSYRFAVGQEVQLKEPLAFLFADLEALLAHESAEQARAAAAASNATGPLLSEKARRRAEELKVPLELLPSGRLITVKDVEELHAKSAPVDLSSLPAPLSAPPGVERVLLIGGSRAATQIIDIFRDGSRQRAVAILDDSRALWGQEVYGVPVCGGTDRLGALFAAGAFDAAIVAISTSIPARKKFRELCAGLGVPLTNAIDRTAKLSSDVRIGRGNIICAFCHFGTGVVIGDNNFISAYNSYDHHSEIGNDCSTGPGCITSGRGKLRDRVRMGAGIFLEPGVELGEGAQVASGAILVKSVPAHHAVKTKIVTTAVVPIKK